MSGVPALLPPKKKGKKKTAEELAAERAAALLAAACNAAQQKASSGGIVCTVRKVEGQSMGFDFGEDLSLRGVRPGTPADRAGMARFVGMKLKGVNGKAIHSLKDCKQFMNSPVLDISLVPTSRAVRPPVLPKSQMAPAAPKKKLPSMAQMDNMELERLRRENERLVGELCRAQNDSELDEAPYEDPYQQQEQQQEDDDDDDDDDSDDDDDDSDSDSEGGGSDSSSSSSSDSDSDSDASSEGHPAAADQVPVGHVVVPASSITPADGAPGQVIVSAQAVQAAKEQAQLGAMVLSRGDDNGPAPPMLKPVQGRPMQLQHEGTLTSNKMSANSQTSGAESGVGGQLMAASGGIVGSSLVPKLQAGDNRPVGSVVPAKTIGQVTQAVRELGHMGVPALKAALQQAAAQAMPQAVQAPQMTDDERLAQIDFFSKRYPITQGCVEEMRQLDVVGLRIATAEIPADAADPFCTDYSDIVMDRIRTYKEEGAPEGNDFGQEDRDKQLQLALLQQSEGRQYQVGGKIGEGGRLTGQRVSEDDWRVLPNAISRPKDDGQKRSVASTATLQELAPQPNTVHCVCAEGHYLEAFQCEKLWVCSGCRKKFQKGCWFSGCDRCNWDLCEDCGILEDGKQTVAAATATIIAHALLSLGTWKYKPAPKKDTEDDDDFVGRERRKRKEKLDFLKQQLSKINKNIKQKEQLLDKKQDRIAKARDELATGIRKHSRSRSDSRRRSPGRRRSASPRRRRSPTPRRGSRTPPRRRRSSTPRRRRRSSTPRRGGRTPPRRRSATRRRSSSSSSLAKIQGRQNPKRSRSKTPPRRRASRTPPRRRSRTPPRRKASRTPPRRKASRSPTRKSSRTPPRRKASRTKSSRTPPRRKASRTPTRKSSRTPPRRKASRTPPRRRSRTPPRRKGPARRKSSSSSKTPPRRRRSSTGSAERRRRKAKEDREKKEQERKEKEKEKEKERKEKEKEKEKERKEKEKERKERRRERSEERTNGRKGGKRKRSASDDEEEESEKRVSRKKKEKEKEKKEKAPTSKGGKKKEEKTDRKDRAEKKEKAKKDKSVDDSKQKRKTKGRDSEERSARKDKKKKRSRADSHDALGEAERWKKQEEKLRHTLKKALLEGGSKKRRRRGSSSDSRGDT